MDLFSPEMRLGGKLNFLHWTKTQNIHQHNTDLDVITLWNNMKLSKHTYSNEKLKFETK